MPATAAEDLKEMNARFLTLSKAAPQVFGAFRNLMTELSKDGFCCRYRSSLSPSP